MSRSMDRTAAVVAALLLTVPIVVVAVPAAPGVSPTAAGSGSANPDTTQATVIASSDGTSAQLRSRNESASPHVNPDEAASSGNLTAVRRWLAVNVENVLVGCARRISVNETSNGTCQPLVDDETYPSLVSRYRTVASETRTSNDDRVAEVLDQVDDRQVEFVGIVLNYRTTLESYREAKRQNQSRRALELARNISILAGRLRTVGSRLSDDYDLLSSRGGMSLEPARRIVSAARTNATRTADRIRTEEFSVPTMTLRANRTAVSFTDPAVLSGELRNDQGAALSGRLVVVEMPAGLVRTRTDENGTFAVRYRPTTAPLGNATVVARYLPRNDSIYRPTSVETTISIRRTTGTLRVTNSSSTVRFGDELRVRGVVRVNGTAVSGLPLVVTVDERRIAGGETNDSGRFNITGRLPGAIAPGNRTVTVRPADGERAVTTNPASATVRVVSTTPRLVVGTERLNADTVRLFGRMSVGDAGVAGARLQVRRDGESVTAVRLDGAGSFETNVSLPGVSAGSTAVVTVVYDPSTGNLEPVTVRAEVSSAPRRLPDVAELRETVTDWLAWVFELDPRQLAVGVLAVLSVFLVAMGTAYRMGSGSGLGLGWLPGVEDDGTNVLTTGSGDGTPNETGPGRSGGGPGESLLDVARTRLDDGRTDDAVIAAYGGVRTYLARTLGADPSLTHWELLVISGDALDDEGRVALERLTAAYESAAFSSGRSTAATAREALDAATVVIDSSSSAGD